MVGVLINEFRQQNGIPPFYYWNNVENQYCVLHCLHMSKVGCRHADFYNLLHRREAVAKWHWDWDLKHTVSLMLWDSKDGFISSPGHKAVLLMNNIAYGVVVDNGEVYLTVRGWN